MSTRVTKSEDPMGVASFIGLPTQAALAGQAICKDCGAGTLNNAINEQFDFVDGAVVCNSCGGSHVDGELYFNGEVL